MGTQVTETMQWIHHGGQHILLADYGSLRGDELVRAIAANRDAIVKFGEGGRRNLLILTDVSSAVIGPEALGAFKDVANAMRPYTAASAVVGVTKARKFLLQTVNMFSSMKNEPADTVEQAKDWLAKQGEG